MDERILQFRVGIVVLAAALVTGILIMVFGVGIDFQSDYTVYMVFPQAPGVTVDTPIRKNGILIGRVSDVELLDEGVRLTGRIESDRIIKESEVPRIGTASLLGDSVIEFVPISTPVTNPGDYKDGDTIENGEVAPNPMAALESLADLQEDVSVTLKAVEDAGNTVAKVGETVDTAGKDFSKLAQRLDKTLADNEDRIARLLMKSETAIDDFSSAMSTVNALLGDEGLQNELRKSLADLPTLFADAQNTMAAARATLENFQRLGTRFESVGASAERNLANLEGLTEPLGRNGEKLATSMNETLENVDTLVKELQTFSQTLNNNEGSLGALVSDKELYNKLNRAANNIEDASRKLRPILTDVRVFTDKIARDPRQLGVKGALDQRPSGTGLKPTIGFTPRYPYESHGYPTEQFRNQSIGRPRVQSQPVQRQPVQRPQFRTPQVRISPTRSTQYRSQ